MGMGSVEHIVDGNVKTVNGKLVKRKWETWWEYEENFTCLMGMGRKDD